MAVQLAAEQCVCSRDKDFVRIEGRIEKVEDKLELQCEMIYKMEAAATITNDHLARIEAALEKFPEAEKAVWTEHWEQVFERQNKILEAATGRQPNTLKDSINKGLFKLIEWLIVIILLLLGAKLNIFDFFKGAA